VTLTVQHDLSEHEVYQYRGFATPGCQTMIVESAAFADGYRVGLHLCEQQDDDHFHLRTDTEFTELILQYLPRQLSPEDCDQWRQGFIFGWTLAWYHLPMHNEGACAALSEGVQRVHLIGSWLAVKEKAAEYSRQFADRLDVEVVEWGPTEKHCCSYIALEWLGAATPTFELFLAQVLEDPTVEEIISYEAPIPCCPTCLPHTTMLPRANHLLSKVGAHHA
jgi:hypothetical protein